MVDGLVIELGADEEDFLLRALDLESKDDTDSSIGGECNFPGTRLANLIGGDVLLTLEFALLVLVFLCSVSSKANISSSCSFSSSPLPSSSSSPLPSSSSSS